MRPKRIFRKHIVFSSVCDFVLFYLICFFGFSVIFLLAFISLFHLILSSICHSSSSSSFSTFFFSPFHYLTPSFFSNLHLLPSASSPPPHTPHPSSLSSLPSYFIFPLHHVFILFLLHLLFFSFSYFSFVTSFFFLPSSFFFYLLHCFLLFFPSIFQLPPFPFLKISSHVSSYFLFLSYYLILLFLLVYLPFLPSIFLPLVFPLILTVLLSFSSLILSPSSSFRNLLFPPPRSLLYHPLCDVLFPSSYPSATHPPSLLLLYLFISSSFHDHHRIIFLFPLVFILNLLILPLLPLLPLLLYISHSAAPTTSFRGTVLNWIRRFYSILVLWP